MTVVVGKHVLGTLVDNDGKTDVLREKDGSLAATSTSNLTWSGLLLTLGLHHKRLLSTLTVIQPTSSNVLCIFQLAVR